VSEWRRGGVVEVVKKRKEKRRKTKRKDKKTKTLNR
jgi:hypothetical protein